MTPVSVHGYADRRTSLLELQKLAGTFESLLGYCVESLGGLALFERYRDVCCWESHNL